MISAAYLKNKRLPLSPIPEEECEAPCDPLRTLSENQHLLMNPDFILFFQCEHPVHFDKLTGKHQIPKELFFDLMRCYHLQESSYFSLHSSSLPDFHDIQMVAKYLLSPTPRFFSERFLQVKKTLGMILPKLIEVYRNSSKSTAYLSQKNNPSKPNQQALKLVELPILTKETPFQLVEKGDCERLEIFLKTGVVSANDELCGQSLLQKSVETDQEDVCALLIEYGASYNRLVEIKNEKKDSKLPFLRWVIKNEKRRVMLALIKKDPQILYLQTFSSSLTLWQYIVKMDAVELLDAIPAQQLQFRHPVLLDDEPCLKKKNRELFSHSYNDHLLLLLSEKTPQCLKKLLDLNLESIQKSSYYPFYLKCFELSLVIKNIEFIEKMVEKLLQAKELIFSYPYLKTICFCLKNFEDHFSIEFLSAKLSSCLMDEKERQVARILIHYLEDHIDVAAFKTMHCNQKFLFTLLSQLNLLSNNEVRGKILLKLLHVFRKNYIFEQYSEKEKVDIIKIFVGEIYQAPLLKQEKTVMEFLFQRLLSVPGTTFDPQTSRKVIEILAGGKSIEIREAK